MAGTFSCASLRCALASSSPSKAPIWMSHPPCARICAGDGSALASWRALPIQALPVQAWTARPSAFRFGGFGFGRTGDCRSLGRCDDDGVWCVRAIARPRERAARRPAAAGAATGTRCWHWRQRRRLHRRGAISDRPHQQRLDRVVEPDRRVAHSFSRSRSPIEARDDDMGALASATGFVSPCCSAFSVAGFALPCSRYSRRWPARCAAARPP